MNLNEYQNFAAETAIYRDICKLRLFRLNYTILGLTGEAGELANKLKKVFRDRLSIDGIREDLLSELGDCLWYVSQAACELDCTLEELAARNLGKLRLRMEAGKIKGSGDAR